MMDHLLPLTAGGSTSASATLDPNVPASSLAPSSHAGDTHATLLSSIELINGDIGTGKWHVLCLASYGRSQIENYMVFL